MPPVTATGNATSTAATMVAGAPEQVRHVPPRRHEEAFRNAHQGKRGKRMVDPKSVQADFGTGMRENVPNAAPIASAIFTL